MLIRWQSTIVDQRGNVVPGAVLTVRRESDQSIAAVYRDAAGADPYPTGTVTADENGYAYFYGTPGLYRLTSLVPAIDWRDVNLQSPNVSIGGPVYASTEDGLAATTDGDYFSVPSADAGGYLDLYRNDSGVASYIDTYPNKAAIADLSGDVAVVQSTLTSVSRETVSDNLLDLTRITNDSRLSNIDGTVFSAPGFFVSDWIPVAAGVEYRNSYADRIAFYTVAKAFISISEGSNTAVAPAGAAFARATYAMNEESTSMFAESATYPAEFQPFADELFVPDLHMDSAAVTAAVSGLTADQTSFVTRSSPNLFDPATVTPGKRINSVNGILLDYALGGASDWIPVEPGTTYTQTEGNYFAEYDENRQFVIGYTPGTTQFTTAAQTRFVRVTVRDVIMASYMLVAGSVLPGVYQPYAGYTQSGTILLPSGANGRWAGKKWNVMGDSITADAASYWRQIALNLRFDTARDYGIGGTSIAYRDAPPGAPDPTLYTEKWMANRYIDMDVDADLVTVAGGTNDFRQIALGSFDVRDNATVYGATRTLCEGLADRFPTAVIGAILPFHRYDSVATYVPYTFMALRDVLLEVYAFYGIAVFDSTQRLPIRFWNTGQADVWSRVSASTGLPDGLHPNEIAHAAIAMPIQEWLLSL